MTLPRSVALCLLTATLGPSAGSGPRESTEVLRAQVELSVCDARNAGTDDPVSASLGAGAVTWLDHPGRDLERGGRYRYDLLLDGVGSLADIRGLTISKVGADDLCLAELRLIVNGSTIFVRAFAGGTWLERDLASSAAELRANAAWQSYGWSMSEWVAKTGAAVSRGELLERLESGIASAIHGAGLSWKDGAAPALAVRRKDDATIAVRAALMSEVPYWLNNDVTLEFDLSPCEPRVIAVFLRPVARWYSAVQLRQSASDDERMLTLVRARLERSRPIVVAGGICPRVDGNADIVY